MEGHGLGSSSYWHWIIILVLIFFPLIFVFRSPPSGPNRFGAAAMPMSFVEAIASYFRNFVNFQGRAARSEYWFSFLFAFGSSIVADIIDNSGIISVIWSLILFLPSIAVAARRLHDINRSGWHQLLYCFAPVGLIVVIVWYCTPGRDET